MSATQKYIIVKDRVEIYMDFTINLLNYIIDYYLDRQTLSNDVDIRNHFNWCFNKVCDEFKLESLDFSKNEKLREYFYQFFYNQFYKRENQDITFGYFYKRENQDITLGYYEKFWRNIFEIDKQKNKNVINTMIEIYNIFDTSINQGKNILEIV